MAKRGSKVHSYKEEDYDGPVKDNFLELEAEFNHRNDSRDIERYIPSFRNSESSRNNDDDSFAYWWGQS